MKKSAGALLLFALCLFAADFWTKPFGEWTDKDLQKMVSNSPWARTVNVPMNGPTPPSLGSPLGRDADPGVPSPISEGGGGGRGGRGGRPSGPDAAGPPAGFSSPVVIRWQSALPVKQALARLQYGAETAIPAEARRGIETADADYVIVVAGPLQPFLRGDLEALKEAAKQATQLAVKGKAALKPSDVKFGSVQKTVQAYFAFPRSAAFSPDDKEAEFSTRLGDLTLKQKFRFKDMTVNGKLEL